VLSADEHDPHAAPQWRRVEEIFRNYMPIWHVHVEDQVIRTTSEHPFYVWNKGWIAARELMVGDLLRSHDGQFVVVKDICEGGYEEAVYNCRINEYHTYFIGGESWGWSVWAHNECAMESLANMGIKGWSTGKGAVHLVKHGLGMGFSTVAQYTNAAKEFAKLQGSGFIVSKIGNHFFKFQHGTNLILVVNGNGKVIKTFYHADYGIKSFKEAMQQHIKTLTNLGHY
jgi:Pretoxin HINT domain